MSTSHGGASHFLSLKSCGTMSANFQVINESAMEEEPDHNAIEAMVERELGRDSVKDSVFIQKQTCVQEEIETKDSMHQKAEQAIHVKEEIEDEDYYNLEDCVVKELETDNHSTADHYNSSLEINSMQQLPFNVKKEKLDSEEEEESETNFDNQEPLFIPCDVIANEATGNCLLDESNEDDIFTTPNQNAKSKTKRTVNNKHKKSPKLQCQMPGENPKSHMQGGNLSSQMKTKNLISSIPGGNARRFDDGQYVGHQMTTDLPQKVRKFPAYIVDYGKYACDQCTKCFSRRGDLQRHHTEKHEDVRFPCTQCAKTFSRKSNLQTHMAMHVGVKACSCPICSATFTRKNDLTRHLMIHQGLKFACDQCPKKFNQKSSLLRHIEMSHKGVRYECDMCARNFQRKNMLNKHRAMHLMEENKANQITRIKEEMEDESEDEEELEEDDT